MDDISSTSLFAGRYRFEPLEDEWDTGSSGLTYPAIDIQTNRRVVIKRADATSPHAEQQEHSLRNEAKALKALEGLGVPKLYDVNQADYGARHFTYLVMEYIDEIRVEKHYGSFNAIERAQILTELFRLLAEAHRRGIINGDVDLKHLYWRREKKQLIIIDWGNSNIGVDPQKNNQFAYDLARSAEIIYSLVTYHGEPPATGTLALPEKKDLYTGMLHLPDEFYSLCKFAPRNPPTDVNAPFTATELYNASNKWLGRMGIESYSRLRGCLRS